MDKNELYTQYIDSMYEELSELGLGEQGRTFLAKHRGSGRIVVKKQIPMENGRVYERIKEIQHPNVAKIYEVYECREQCIVIEEYISGETLAEKLERRKKLPAETVEDYVIQIVKGMAEIHEKGVVHRDLTPANILISSDGVVKLIDFGIARSAKENQSKDTTILGTVGYASPEQFGFCQTDQRTDIYALGILINEMLTGVLPSETLTQNEKFQKIVLRCTQMDPEKRYASGEELLKQLHVSEPVKAEGDLSIWPGFRSGIKWRRITAVIGYVLLGMFTVVPLWDCGTNLTAWLLESIAISIYVWLTFFIASNFGRWDRHIWPFYQISKEVMVTLRIIACLVTIYAGCQLENYVKYVILGMSRT